MKEIHVRAYCQANLGDDLFILQLTKRYPQHQFYVYAISPNDAAFREIPNIVLPDFKSRVIRKLTHVLHVPRKEKFDGQGVDLSVTIGGSILWENADISFGGQEIDRYLIGPNCDRGYSAAFLKKLREAIAGVSHCCFRDTYSYNLFRDLPNVSYAPDVLFDYEPHVMPRSGYGIGISVVSPERKMKSAGMQEAYYNAMARVCDLCREQELPVQLLGFCRAEGDEEAIAQILSRTADPAYPAVYTYHGDVDEMMQRINACETILATRFHGMILGWVLKKNVVPVIYSEKQSHVLEDIGFRGESWNLMQGEPMSGEELLEAARNESGRMNVFELKEKSKKQFEALDCVLNEK